MKKILKFNLIPLFILLLMFPFFVSADFSINNWLFYKTIDFLQPFNIAADAVEQEVFMVRLDDEVFSRARSDLGDLRIISDKTTEHPFRLVKNGEEEIARRGEILNPSSVRESFRGESFGPEKMIDGNYDTYFQNDYLKEPSGANFVIDLNEQVFTKKIVIISNDSANTWKSIQVEGSDDLNNWRIVKNRTFMSFSPRREIIYPESFFRYLRLSFEHTGSLKINEVQVYSALGASLLFLSDSRGINKNNYRLYYGNDLAATPVYKMDKLLPEFATPLALSAELVNPDGKADYDKDNVSNTADNCVFVSNQDQKDNDDDKIGDACDNCLSLRNPDQQDNNNNGKGDVCEDNDDDKILNIVDNCPNYSNADQGDENNNGMGDACEDFDGDGIMNSQDNCVNNYNSDQTDIDKDGKGDVCDSQDSRWTEKQPYLLWLILGGVAAVVVFFGIRLLKKMNQV